jgi:hypothetical protein
LVGPLSIKETILTIVGFLAGLSGGLFLVPCMSWLLVRPLTNRAGSSEQGTPLLLVFGMIVVVFGTAIGGGVFGALVATRSGRMRIRKSFATWLSHTPTRRRMASAGEGALAGASLGAVLFLGGLIGPLLGGVIGGLLGYFGAGTAHIRAVLVGSFVGGVLGMFLGGAVSSAAAPQACIVGVIVGIVAAVAGGWQGVFCAAVAAWTVPELSVRFFHVRPESFLAIAVFASLFGAAIGRNTSIAREQGNLNEHQTATDSETDRSDA